MAPPSPPPRPPADSAADRALRNRLIVRLADAGECAGALARGFRLSRQHVGRILLAAESAAAAATARAIARLTPAELRGLLREHKADPETIAWLHAIRPDRRHNGRPIYRRETDTRTRTQTEDTA